MGDVIHTLPAAQALREAFPNAMIGWLIEERWAELLCAPGTPRRGPRSAQRPLVDWVHTVDLTSVAQVAVYDFDCCSRSRRVWNDVRSARYDVAVDLQGAIRSAVLARWSGARVVYGAAEPRESPASLWYTRQAIARGAHVIEQNLSVAEAVAQRKMKVPRVELPRDAGGRAADRPAAGGSRSRRLRDSESRRGMGSEALARGTLRSRGSGAGRATACARFSTMARAKKIWRARLRPRAKARRCR